MPAMCSTQLSRLSHHAFNSDLVCPRHELSTRHACSRCSTTLLSCYPCIFVSPLPEGLWTEEGAASYRIRGGTIESPDVEEVHLRQSYRFMCQFGQH
jgi:hypothetical protein